MRNLLTIFALMAILLGSVFSIGVFAQDIVYEAPLEDTTATIGSNLTNDNCAFVAGRYGNGVECDDDDDDVNFSPSSNIDFAKGAVELWMQPKWDHTDGKEMQALKRAGG